VENMTHEIFRDTVFILKDEMYRFAKKYVISSDEAEDVVQDLMMKFWQRKDNISEIENFRSFAMKSVKNECLNRLKHEEVKRSFVDFHIHRSEFHRPEINNLRDEIIKFIGELPEKQKAVIHLKDVEEYEIPEIALWKSSSGSKIGCSSTIDSQIILNVWFPFLTNTRSWSAKSKYFC
jgi:RNA polymerase sigma-70 factor (ECF subfamily)